jgi:hypothetical protein
MLTNTAPSSPSEVALATGDGKQLDDVKFIVIVGRHSLVQSGIPDEVCIINIDLRV